MSPSARPAFARRLGTQCLWQARNACPSAELQKPNAQPRWRRPSHCVSTRTSQYDCSKRARSCFTTDSPFPRAPSRRHHLRLPRPAGEEPCCQRGQVVGRRGKYTFCAHPQGSDYEDPHPRTASRSGRPDRSSRLGTLPSAKLKDRYAQTAACSGAPVRNPLAKIPFTTIPTDGSAT